MSEEKKDKNFLESFKTFTNTIKVISDVVTKDLMLVIVPLIFIVLLIVSSASLTTEYSIFLKILLVIILFLIGAISLFLVKRAYDLVVKQKQLDQYLGEVDDILEKRKSKKENIRSDDKKEED